MTAHQQWWNGNGSPPIVVLPPSSEAQWDDALSSDPWQITGPSAFILSSVDPVVRNTLWADTTRDSGLRYFEILAHDASSSVADNLIGKLGLAVYNADFTAGAHWPCTISSLDDPDHTAENDPATDGAAFRPGWGTLCTIMVAWNATTGKLWFGKNGSWGTDGQDPATGTKPAFTGVTGTLRPFIRYNAIINIATHILKTTDAEFTYTPPTGFSQFI